MRSFHWNACSLTRSFLSKCTILTFAPQMFGHLFCYKKSVFNKRKNNVHTTHSHFFQPTFMKQTTGSDSFWVSKKKFPKWGKDMFSFYQALNAGVLICSLHFIINPYHIYTDFLVPHTSFRPKYRTLLLLLLLQKITINCRFWKPHSDQIINITSQFSENPQHYHAEWEQYWNLT